MRVKTTEEIMELVFDYGQARISEYHARNGDQMALMVVARNNIWKTIEESIDAAIETGEKQ